MLNRGDYDLVQATLAGDNRAYDELLSRYEAKVYNVAFRVTGNAEDALDATQSAFVKAYDNLSRFNPAHRFFSWIYRIGLNEALNLVQRQSRFTELTSDVRHRQADPESVCQGREAGGAIEAALDQLSQDYRAVIVLRHIEGLSYEEIAEATGVPAKTVKSRLFSARRELRCMLTERGFWG